MKNRYHLIGIGGAGMSAIAQILHDNGHFVSGSDRSASDVTARLSGNGIRVFIGHCAENMGDIDCVVYSAAIPQDNPEMLEAKMRGIPVLERPVMLGKLMEPYKVRVGVSGVHGKTTTTSMLNSILSKSPFDATVLIGADVASLSGNAKLGSDSIFVTEACEAFSSFLHLKPSIAIITNIEADHLDHYKTVKNVEAAFLQFINNTDKDGCVIANWDDERTRKICLKADRRIVSYGFAEDAQFRAVNADLSCPRVSFDLMVNKKSYGRIQLGVPGDFNILNALAAIAAAFEMGIDFETIKTALYEFIGAQRRFEMMYDDGKITVIDDYAHHPTELKATLQSVKRAYKDKNIIAVFQPHLYSRTQFFAKDFAEALSIADEIVLNSIYAAREEPIPGITSKTIADILIQMGHSNVKTIDKRSDVVDYLMQRIKENHSAPSSNGDLIIILGAGDIREVSEEVGRRLDKCGE